MKEKLPNLVKKIRHASPGSLESPKEVGHKKETGTQINGLDQKEERNIQPEQNEETRIQNSNERLRNLQNNFKRSDIQIIGVLKGEKEEQGIENIMENFPNLAKEIDFQEFQKTQKSQKS